MKSDNNYSYIYKMSHFKSCTEIFF